MDSYGEGYEAGEKHGERSEKARLRPLLERCEALALAQLHLHQRLPRPDAEAVALFENLLADLRAELGKDGGGVNRRAHEALYAECSGYAAFVAEEQEMDADLGALIDFADWFLSGGENADTYASWSAADFRAEWDHWNS